MLAEAFDRVDSLRPRASSLVLSCVSATHRLTVRSLAGKTATLHIAPVHPDEHTVPLFRTALVSMLSESLSAAEEAGAKVAAATREAFTDEPDEEEAAAILRAVRLLEVEGKVRAKAEGKGVVFARGKRRSVVVEVDAKRAGLFAHLREGLQWEAAPLYPELEEGWTDDLLDDD